MDGDPMPTTLDRTTMRMLAAEPYIAEVALSVISMWGAWALWHPPSNFSAYKGTFLWIAAQDPNEQHWAMLLTLAALLKLGGLFCCLKLRLHGIGLWCRGIGLSISAFFWTALGLSAISGNPDTLTAGVPVIMWGLSAVWALLRFPWMPGRER